MRKDNIMRKYKNHVKAANMLLQSLYQLKHERLRKIQQKLEDFSSRCSDVTKNSRIFQRAVDRCYYPSAEKIRSRISRDLNDFLHQLDQFRNTINADDIKVYTARTFQVGGRKQVRH